MGSGYEVVNEAVLRGCRIHGVLIHHHSDSNDCLTLAVYGNHQVVLLQLNLEQAKPGSEHASVSVLKLAHVPHLPHWILQVEITTCQPIQPDGCKAHRPGMEADQLKAAQVPSRCRAVLGLMDNSVELWAFSDHHSSSEESSCGEKVHMLPWEGACIARVECQSRLLLYSLSLKVLPECTPGAQPHHATTVGVASGMALFSKL